MDIPQKIKTEPQYDPAVLSGRIYIYIFEGHETTTWKI